MPKDNNTTLSFYEAGGVYLCRAFREDIFKTDPREKHGADVFRRVAMLPYFPTVDGEPGGQWFEESLAYRFFVTAVQLPADHESQMTVDGAYWCIVWRKRMERGLRLVAWARPGSKADAFAKMQKEAAHG
jgi:hypothetical protein